MFCLPLLMGHMSPFLPRNQPSIDDIRLTLTFINSPTLDEQKNESRGRNATTLVA